MLNLDNSPRFIQYLAYVILFILGQSAAIWGLFSNLHFKNLSMFQAYKMAIPFAWLDWLFMTFAVNIGNKYDLVTPTQDTFVLIFVQFSIILIINQFYLKQNIFKSDIIAFFIIVIGISVSFLNIFSKIFGIPIHKEKTNSFTKIKLHREINT